jgi:hypothetical protein
MPPGALAYAYDWIRRRQNKSEKDRRRRRKLKKKVKKLTNNKKKGKRKEPNRIVKVVENVEKRLEKEKKHIHGIK